MKSFKEALKAAKEVFVYSENTTTKDGVCYKTTKIEVEYIQRMESRDKKVYINWFSTADNLLYINFPDTSIFK